MTTAQDLYAQAADAANVIEGKQWRLGEIGIEVKRLADYGKADFATFAKHARRSKSSCYGYANCVQFYQNAGFSNWSHFCRQYPNVPFTIAQAAAEKFADDTAALSWLEDANEREFSVDQARASLKGIFNPGADKKVGEFEAWLTPSEGAYALPIIVVRGDDATTALSAIVKQFEYAKQPLRIVVYAPAVEAEAA